jgi:hypothetical protein
VSQRERLFGQGRPARQPLGKTASFFFVAAFATLAAFPEVTTTQANGPEPERVRLAFQVILIDGSLNQKPVPRLAIELRLKSSGPAVYSTRTGFDGVAELDVKPGSYQLLTPQGVEFQGKHYSWTTNVVVTRSGQRVVLSNDNAATPDTQHETNAVSQTAADVFTRLRGVLDANTPTPPAPAPTSATSSPPPQPGPSTPLPLGSKLASGVAFGTAIEPVYVGEMGSSDHAERFRALLRKELTRAGFSVVEKPEEGSTALTGTLVPQLDRRNHVVAATATVSLHQRDGSMVWTRVFEPRVSLFGPSEAVALRARDVASALKGQFSKNH